MKTIHNGKVYDITKMRFLARSGWREPVPGLMDEFFFSREERNSYFQAPDGEICEFTENRFKNWRFLFWDKPGEWKTERLRVLRSDEAIGWMQLGGIPQHEIISVLGLKEA